MSKEIITTEDEDIIIERTINDNPISKKELRKEKQNLKDELKGLNDQIDLLKTYKIDKEIKYLLENEIDNFKIERDRVKERIDEINSIIKKE